MYRCLQYLPKKSEGTSEERFMSFMLSWEWGKVMGTGIRSERVISRQDAIPISKPAQDVDYGFRVCFLGV